MIFKLLDGAKFLIKKTLNSGDDKIYIVGDTKLSTLRDDKTGVLVTDGIITILEKEVAGGNTDPLWERIRFDNVVDLGAEDGKNTYEVTIKKIETTRMRGMAVSDSFSDDQTDIISSRIIPTFPQGSVALLAVNVSTFRNLSDAVKGGSSQLSEIATTSISANQPIQRNEAGEIVPYQGGSVIGVAINTVTTGQTLEYYTRQNGYIEGISGFSAQTAVLFAYANWDNSNPSSAVITRQDNPGTYSTFIGYFNDNTTISLQPEQQTFPVSATTTQIDAGVATSAFVSPLGLRHFRDSESRAYADERKEEAIDTVKRKNNDRVYIKGATIGESISFQEIRAIGFSGDTVVDTNSVRVGDTIVIKKTGQYYFSLPDSVHITYHNPGFTPGSYAGDPSGTTINGTVVDLDSISEIADPWKIPIDNEYGKRVLNLTAGDIVSSKVTAHISHSNMAVASSSSAQLILRSST